MSSDAATAGGILDDKGFSLSEKFHTFNHVRHTLMDISMIGMAIAGLVATGSAIGFLDPIWAWMKMHVSGIPGLAALPDFISAAGESLSDGAWFTGTEPVMDHGTHGGEGAGGWHGGEADTDHTETHNQTHEPSPEQQADIERQADKFGVSTEEYSDGWQPHHQDP